MITLIAAFLFGNSTVYAQEKYNPKYLTEKNDPLTRDAKTLTPNGWIEMKEETSVAPDQFFERYGTSLGLTANPHLKFEQTKSETGAKGAEHRRYQLYYDNVEVEGLEFFLHAQEDKVRSASGKIVSELEINVEKRLSEAEALESALKQLGIGDQRDDKERPQGELLISRVNIEDFSAKSFVLMYKFLLNDPKSLGASDVYVDAKTGKILKKITAVYRCFTPGLDVGSETTHESTLPTEQKAGFSQPPQSATFIPIFNRYLQGQSSLPFMTYVSNGVQHLQFETYVNGINYPAGLRTKEYVNNDLIACPPNPTYGSSSQDTRWNNIPLVTNSSTNWQTNHQEATTAHWAIQKTYEYYRDTHNRNGINTNHGYLGYMLTNIPQTAFCGMQGPVYRPNFGSQNNNAGIGLITVQSFTGESFATLDVLAHEYSHRVTKMLSNLTYQGEPGALNESFSDIIGYCVERRVLPNDWNWLIAEDVAGPNRALRNMQDPGSIPNSGFGQVTQPDTYLGANWRNTANTLDDHGGVHWNSGVMNHWFYLLVAGGTQNGRTVTGIDFAKSEEIFYDAFAHRVGSQAMYADARTATLDAAISLYGNCSAEHFQVGEAWAAVGVGTGSGCASDCSFTISPTVSNSNPACGASITLTANCSGTGCNGVNYQWDVQGNIQSGQSISVNAPSSPGNYNYLVASTKNGCNGDLKVVNLNTNCSLPLSNGCYTIKAKHSDKFMQPENGNNGARIRQYSGNGQNNQIFELEGVDGDSYKIKAWGTNRV